MTSTPEPSAGQNPPPPSYPEPEDREGHRLGAGVVALIIAVIVVIAAGVTAAVVFTHKPAPQNPPQPSPGGEAVQPVASPAASTPPTGTHTPSLTLTGPAEPDGNQQTLTYGDAVDLSGTSVTPADGWSVGSQGDKIAVIGKDDGSASILFVVGKSNSTDAEETLNGDISNAIDKLGLANLKVTKTETGRVTSENFQEVAKRGFLADISTQQGTMHVIGMFLEFMNTETQNSAFVMFTAKDEKSFDAAVDDVNGMIRSML